MARSKHLAPFYPFEWQVPVLLDKAPVVLMTGSAGGGKSRTGLEKLHAFLSYYPDATGLMLRKAREYANKSIVPFMRNAVQGNDPRINMNKAESFFAYPNGSTLWWGGMLNDDQREAIRSIGKDGSVDFILMEEATAFTRTDFDELLGRMRGKAAPWVQILLMTNPDAPGHWIYQDLILGKEASVYYSSADMNPSNPAHYLQSLASMKGVQADRLAKGMWVTAAGAIYPNFRLEGNVTDDAKYHAHLPVYWGIDDGFADGNGPGNANYHPRVVLFCQILPGGVISIFDEYYETGITDYNETIDTCLGVTSRRYTYRLPEAAYIDSSAAMFAGALWKRGIYNVGMTHEVAEGIKNLRELIGSDDTIRRVIINGTQCPNLVREMTSYAYDDKSKVAKIGEGKPRKVDDHGPDALRYLAWAAEGA